MGYWNNPEQTSHTFFQRLKSTCTEVGSRIEDEPFIRSGDLGCWYNGQLYITGRLKEMLIIRGTKYYPHDIEECIKEAATDSLRPGSIVATSIEVGNEEEQLIIIVELVDAINPTQSAASKPKLQSSAVELGVKNFKNTKFPTASSTSLLFINGKFMFGFFINR